MLLSALAEYYRYKTEEAPDEMARPGWAPQKVVAQIVLDEQGNLLGINGAGKDESWTFSVPTPKKRSSGVAANLLADTAQYLLGVGDPGKEARTLECFQASREEHREALDGVESAAPVLAFFESWDPAGALEHPEIQRSRDLLKSGFLVFAVSRDGVLQQVLGCDDVRVRIDDLARAPSPDAEERVCLVSHKRGPVARLHPAIKGVPGAQSSGATLVGFNLEAFESYGQTQGSNAPVSESVAFQYGTALNYLLGDPRHRLRIGDTTVVYWATLHDDDVARLFSQAVDPDAERLERRRKRAELRKRGQRVDKEEERALTLQDVKETDQRLAGLFEAVRTGAPLAEVPVTRAPFYVAGLAPNAARLSLRFFWQGEFGDVLSNLDAHYRRLRIEHAPFEPAYLSPWRIVKETENPHATKSPLSSILGSSLLDAMLTNGRYPEALAKNVVLRVQANRNVSYPQAAMLKAYLIKNCNESEETMTAELNEQRDDAAYVLGRLFAVLENIQSCAQPSINATIRDRFLDSASSTPATTFPTLLDLANKHLRKLSHDGRTHNFAINRERLVEKLMTRAADAPLRFTMEDRFTFYVGYYQQRQAFFRKRTEDEASEEEVIEVTELTEEN